MKIAVVGYSGAGKSTLTRTLAQTLAIPHLYLDAVNFVPGWGERDREEARQMVRDFMAQNDAWVIDGNYSGLCQRERLERADCIVFLNFPRLRCLWRAWRRSVRYRGRTRESMADGCMEKLDLEFVLWILRDGRTAARRAAFRDLPRSYPGKVAVCKNDRDVARFLSSVTQ